jgi:hypothetical protein
MGHIEDSPRIASSRQSALESSTAALRRLAEYSLPPELDRRMLELGERKDSLSDLEDAELRAWVKFTQQRSIDKFEAQLALQRLRSQFPELSLQS